MNYQGGGSLELPPLTKRYTTLEREVETVYEDKNG